MNRKANPKPDEDILPEYDFSHAVRAKHHKAYATGANVIFLEPDLAKVYKNPESVNRVPRLDSAKENTSTNRRQAARPRRASER